VWVGDVLALPIQTPREMLASRTNSASDEALGASTGIFPILSFRRLANLLSLPQTKRAFPR
jgi:hypothetical protein